MSDISALPVDLWLSIFQKLEPKTLGVSKCVCKNWCNIISSPYFINYHLNLSKSSPSSSSTNLRRRSKDAIRTFPFTAKESHQFTELLVGLSGGICCFRVLMREEEQEGYSKSRVMLWNPTIRICMVLWTIDFGRIFKGLDIAFSCRLVDGFGFEPVSNDYKYVMISGNTSNPIHSTPMVHVYSIAKGGWRSFPFTTNLPDHLRVARSGLMGACVHGVVYWKICVQGIDQADNDHSCGKVMLTFDVRKEEFWVLEHSAEEVEEIEEDMCKGRGMFESCNEYNMESLVLWDKQAKPTTWSRGVSVISAEDLD